MLNNRKNIIKFQPEVNETSLGILRLKLRKSGGAILYIPNKDTSYFNFQDGELVGVVFRRQGFILERKKIPSPLFHGEDDKSIKEN